MQITLVQPAFVDAIWPRISEGLDKAIKRAGGDISPGYLWQECRGGRTFLLVAHEDDRVSGASVWRHETWQDGPAMRCLAMYGAAGHFKELQAEGKRLANHCGADRIVFEGRKGWARSPLFDGFKVRELRVVYEIRD